ncbi:MAG: type II toxin-antitoxin system VapC family toxin [Gemmatimonadaceae bacterium]
MSGSASDAPPVHAAEATPPSTVYIESSALVAAVLEQDIPLDAVLGGALRRVTSALTLAEVYRAVLRARIANRVTDAQEQYAIQSLGIFEERCTIINITDAVLERARRPFPIEPVRTLDAIHLASAELMEGPPQFVTVLTRDARVRDNARALGHPVI